PPPGARDAAAQPAAPLARAPVVVEEEIDLIARFGTAVPEGPRGKAHVNIGALRDDLRMGIVMWPPEGIRFPDVPLHPGARLLFGHGVFSGRARESPPVTFVVRVAAVVPPATVFRDTVAVLPGDLNSWREADVPLPARTGGAARADLVLEVSGGDGATYAGWSWPRVVSQGTPRREAVPERPRRTAGPNVILVVVDALRADHLGAYGYERNTSPSLDAAAARGVVFERAMSTAPWTLPAMTSLLTGLYPSRHGAVYEGGSMPPNGHATLAEAMRRAGYSTAAHVTNPFLGRANLFDRGFDEFHETFLQDAGRVNRRLIERIRERRGEPFFLFVHYVDPHAPYAAPDPFYDHFDPDYSGRVRRNTWPTPPRRRWADALFDAGTLGLRIVFSDRLGENALRLGRVVVAGTALRRRLVNLYDAEIAYWDDSFGAVLDALHETGLADETVVIVTADHGEALGDNGRLSHGADLHDSVLRVPLILFGPGLGPPRRVERQASLVDVMPIVIEIAGLALPGDLDGLPLSRIEGPEGANRAVFAHTAYAGGAGRPGVRGLLFAALRPAAWSRAPGAACARTEMLKAIYEPRTGLWKAFDLAADPAERRPLPPGDARWTALRAPLLEFVRELEARTAGERPPRVFADEAALRALGYIR
ncbi:MAG: sulfatase, partial [Myxococcota bacterium]|nr:sulfatase [Myxococcota bacterium]